MFAGVCVQAYKLQLPAAPKREREHESEALPEQKLVFNGALKRSINMRKKAQNKKQAK